MICSHCHKNFNATAVKDQRGKGLNAQIQCPHCDAWLARSGLLVKLKLLGFYMGAASLLVAWLQAPWRGVAVLVAAMCLALLLISHLMDQLIVVEAPEVEDKSHERQKYR